MLDKNLYTKIQIDALKEIINIGGGNAATSMSEITERSISVKIPRVEVLSYSEIYEQIMGEEEFVNCMIIKIKDENNIGGSFMYVIRNDKKEEIIKTLLPEGMEADEEMEESILKEISNIVINSFLNAISKLLGDEIKSSMPYIYTDMFGAIFSSLYIESEQYDSSIIIMKNDFSYGEDQFISSLYFIPEMGMIENFFEKIGL